MRRTGLSILLLLYACVQLGTIACYYAGPVIHAVCYDLLRLRTGNRRDSGECVLRMDLKTFRNARRDDQEIYCNGECFDISNILLSGDLMILHARKDRRETCWMNAADNLLRRITNNPLPGSHPDPKFCQWLFKLFVPTESMPFVNRAASNVCSKGYRCRPIPVLFAEGPCQPPDPKV